MTILLDVTDARKRLIQHGAVIAGILILLVAGAAAGRSIPLSLALIVAGLALFTVTATTSQKWVVDYKGRSIAYENNAFFGEKLFVDGELVAKGKIGVKSEMRATIASGEAAGDEIVSRSTAGLLRFRCRIHASPRASMRASDEQLMAEVRRRGLV
ncbi:MAG TPA: hypothetical protein VH740_18575 [Vicinamibacterales bacterium]